MKTRSRHPHGAVVFVVMAVVASVLTVVTGPGPAQAVEIPPTFIAAWGTAGTGNGQFSGPSGTAIDPATGDVYVTDTFNHRIQKFTATGTYLSQWGTEGSGDGELSYPTGLAVDPTSGDVYVADTWNDRVQKFTATGTYLTQWGTEAGDGQLVSPGWVAVDAEGDVYVTSGQNRVVKFTATGNYLTQWDSPQSSENGHPEGMAVDGDGNVYVALTSGDINFPGNINVVRKYSSTGTYLTQWGGYGTGAGQFIRPLGVAVDGAGDVYVTDNENDRVQKFTSSGTFLSQWGGYGTGHGRFVSPKGVAVDADGEVFVADGSNRVQRFGIRGRPDGRIRRGTGPQIGNNTYNTNGTGQTRTGTAARGHSVTYYASIQNDAAFAEAIRLKGQPTTSNFTVTYRSAGTNITPQVTAGTYPTLSLPTGAAQQITITVTVRTTAPAHASLARTLTATSTTHPTYKDTVKFVTTRT